MSAERPTARGCDGQGKSVAIVCSRFNEEITTELLVGARRKLCELGVAEDHIGVFRPPGAFELPLVAQHLASSGRFDAVIALGAVIRGETGHYDLVADAAVSGLARVALDTGIPVVFGVLATETTDQARARAGGDLGNRGEDAAITAIEMVALLGEIKSPS